MIHNYIVVLSFLILIILGFPIAYSLIIMGTIGLIISFGFNDALGLVVSVLYGESTTYLLTTVPTYILMAKLLEEADLIDDLFDSMDLWLRPIKGGLLMATAVANGIFAMLSGSSTASAAAISKVAFPRLKKHGYKDKLSIGTIAATGTFAMLFPPSISLIVYGIITDTNIGYLFLAGVLPGLLTLSAYCVVIYFISERATKDNSIEERNIRNLLKAIYIVWPAMVVIAMVLGSIYLGIVTPTEAGAVGVMGSFLIGTTVYDLNLKGIYDSLHSTANITAQIFIIILGAFIFSRYIAVSGILGAVVGLVDTTLPSWGILLTLFVVYIILGMFMNQTSILVLTLPVTYPIAINVLNVDPLWFGIFIIKIAEIGMITPPFGINVFIASSTVDVDASVAFRGALYFIVPDIVVILLLIWFPRIVTIIPNIS